MKVTVPLCYIHSDREIRIVIYHSLRFTPGNPLLLSHNKVSVKF